MVAVAATGVTVLAVAAADKCSRIFLLSVIECTVARTWWKVQCECTCACTVITFTYFAECKLAKKGKKFKIFPFHSSENLGVTTIQKSGFFILLHK